MLSPEFQRRQREFYTAAIVMAAELGRGLGQFFISMPEVLVDHAGDFAGGYLMNWFLNTNMDIIPFFRRIPEKTRIKINAGITLGTVATIETFPIFGTPDLADIPAGVLGVLASYGVRRLAQRWVGEQIK